MVERYLKYNLGLTLRWLGRHTGGWGISTHPCHPPPYHLSHQTSMSFPHTTYVDEEVLPHSGGSDPWILLEPNWRAWRLVQPPNSAIGGDVRQQLIGITDGYDMRGWKFQSLKKAIYIEGIGADA